MRQSLIVFGFLLVATCFEATGDALVRIGLFDKAGFARTLPIVLGAGLLLGYGLCLNLAPLPFARVVGLYIATLFVVWQVVSFVTFKTTPSLPVLIGGALIVIGGLTVSFWGSASSSSD